VARQLIAPGLFAPPDYAHVSIAEPHASTILGVACLGYPGQLVEITAIACG
jgi:hypothetical protein